jgi:hypothetical protein
VSDRPFWLDVLDVAVIPVAILLLGLLWPAIGRYWQRRALRLLILRELAELGPAPKRQSDKTWTDRVRRRCLHRDLLLDRGERQAELALTLNPRLVYELAQMWSAAEEGDVGEWCEHMKAVHQWFRRRWPLYLFRHADIAALEEGVKAWSVLIRGEYQGPPQPGAGS